MNEVDVTLLQAVLDGAGEGLIATDLDGTILLINAAACWLWDYSEAELVGSSIDLLVMSSHDHVGNSRIQYYLDILAGAGTSQLLELYGRTRDGTDFPLECRLRLVQTGARQIVVITVRDLTARRSDEDEVGVSELRFRTMIEQSPLSVQIFAPNGICLQANRAWEELWGVSRDQLTGYNILHDEQLAVTGMAPFIRQAFSGQTAAMPPIRYDPVTSGHAGRVRWVQALAYPVVDERHTMHEIVLILQDVTAAQETAEALRQKTIEQQVLLDTIPALVFYKDRTSTYGAVNQAFATLTARTPSEIAGLTDFELFPDAEAATFRRDDHEVMTSGEPKWNIEETYTGADGATRWSTTYKTPYRDAHGDVVGMVGISLDITERRWGEESVRFLAQASEVLSSSLDYHLTLASLCRLAVPRLADYCLIDIVADDGSLQRLETAHIDPLSEGLMRTLSDKLIADRGARRGVSDVLRTGQSLFAPTISVDALRASASDPEHLKLILALRPTSAMLVPLMAHGDTFGVITFGLTRSPRVYTPNDLELAEELARRASTAIDNARLYQQAQQALRAREQFFSIAAHELRTPITAILGNAQVLQRRAARENTLAERDARALRTLAAQALRLNRLVHTLLDLGAMQTGQLSLEQSQVDIGALAVRVVEETRTSLSRHTIEEQVHDGPLLVQGDDLRLEQVIQNLLQNAIKYSPAGGVVRLELTRAGDEVRVVVADPGIGIPAAALPHLFSQFYRADNVDGAVIAGMGLGLYVVKELVSLHNGTIEVSSIEGQGTSFTVRLPALR